MSDNVSMLDRDGTLLGSFPAGDAPEGIAFDGAHIWVANFSSKSVSKL